MMSLHLKHYFDNQFPNMLTMAMNTQTTNAIIIKCNYFLQRKWNIYMLNVFYNKF